VARSSRVRRASGRCCTRRQAAALCAGQRAPTPIPPPSVALPPLRAHAHKACSASPYHQLPRAPGARPERGVMGRDAWESISMRRSTGSDCRRLGRTSARWWPSCQGHSSFCRRRQCRWHRLHPQRSAAWLPCSCRSFVTVVPLKREGGSRLRVSHGGARAFERHSLEAIGSRSRSAGEHQSHFRAATQESLRTGSSQKRQQRQ